MIRILFLFFLLLVSCSDTVNNTTTTTNVSTTESDTKGDLYVYAMDAISGELIPDVEFSTTAVEDSLQVVYGEKGACFPDLPVGENYAIYASAENYAPVVCNASIKFSENVSSPSMSFVDNTTLNVGLNKLASSLRGSIYYQNPENPTQLDILPAKGAKVTLVVKDSGDCSFLQKKYGPVKVDSNGFFEFDSLPEKANFVLNVHDTKFKGFLFSGMEQEGTLGYAKTATVLPKIVFEKIQTAFGFDFIQDNRSFAQKKDSLKFSFSEPVNSSVLQNKDIRVEKRIDSLTAIAVAINYKWQDSSRTLRIAPAFGEWEFDCLYNIHLKLHSAYSAEIIDTVLEFRVNEFFDLSEKTISEISTSKINYNSNTVTLNWESISGADAYEIYTKIPSRSEKNFKQIAEITSITKGKLDTTYTLQTNGMFANGDSICVLVAARNEKNRSKFGEPLVLKDNTRPQFSKAAQATTTDTANFVINVTTYFKTAAEGTTTIEETFNEPMNTKDSIEISLPKDSPRDLAVDWTWRNNTSLSLSIKVKAGEGYTGEEPLTLPIVIKGLKDIAGNKIDDSKVKDKSWENLVIILHVDGATP